MLKNIGSLTSNELTLILEDHKKYLIFMGDVASFCISEIGWSTVRSYLSPTSHFDVSDPLLMVPKLLVNTEIKLNKVMFFEKRKLIKLYLEYIFPEYEGAACSEFLLRGAYSQTKQLQELHGVIHQLFKGIDDPNKIYGIVSIQAIENTEMVDTLYVRLLGTLNKLK